MTLDRALTTDGAELTLSRRDDQFTIRVDGQELMSSDSHGSEEKLAVHGCAGLRASRGAFACSSAASAWGSRRAPR